MLTHSDTIFRCGQDPVRDDGIIYARVLQKAGTPVRLNVYPGLPHAFAGMYPTIPAAQKYQSDVKEGLTWLLERSSK